MVLHSNVGFIEYYSGSVQQITKAGLVAIKKWYLICCYIIGWGD